MGGELHACSSRRPKPRSSSVRAPRDGGGGDADLPRKRSGSAALDTRIGRDVTIEPNVVFRRRRHRSRDEVTILANCHIAGCHHPQGCARWTVRTAAPPALIWEKALTSATSWIEGRRSWRRAPKANHLAYIGDGHVGAVRQHRRRHDLLQLRRLRQASHHRGQGLAFVGLELRACGTRYDRDGAYVGSG